MRSVLLSLSIASVVAMTAFAPACATPDDGEVEPEATEDQYRTSGTCDGLPKLALQTPAGVCVGLVSQGFTFARGIAQLPSGDFVLAEMGGWAQDRGGVWILRRLPNGQFTKTRIAKLIDKPSGVAVGPDGLPYIGTPNGIFRLDPYEQNADPLPKTGAFKTNGEYKQPKFQLVVKDLPADGRHPLKKFVFDQKNPWNLYVNLGSASDVCEQGSGARPPSGYPMPCKEAEGNSARGSIRLYDLNNPTHVGSSFSTIAHGLRNSMALAVHPTSGALVQGENSRDAINKNDASFNDNEGEFPHEEMNVIVPGSHYGWPYCYDNNSPNPEYRGRVDCSNYTAPALLLPPHASPLGMTYYNGSMLPAAYQGQLLVTFHGYREYGHRLVMVPVDANGIPGSGEPMDIIRGWDKSADGQQPLGSPVDVAVAKDGSLYVTEDKNGDVLRVFFDKNAGNGLPLKALPPVHPVVDPQVKVRCEQLKSKNDLFSIVEKEVIDTSCVGCHGVGPGYAGGLRLDKCDAVGNAKRLLAARSGGRPAYVVPNKLDSEMLLRLKGEGYPQMPAGGVGPEGEEAVIEWIKAGAPAP
jgi:glucose/arabinose dehydrogenase